MKIAVVGAGGHGKVVLDLIKALNMDWSPVFFDDRYPEVITDNEDMVLAGTVKDLINKHRELIIAEAVVAVGDNSLRRQFFYLMKESGLRPATLIHPRATVSSYAMVGEGTMICGHAFIGPGARVGGNCIVNTAASIDHDCQIEDHVHICPGVCLAGTVKIGANSLIGTGANVIPGIAIGRNCIIGAGSTVLNDLPDHITAVGVPARVIRISKEN